MAKQQYIRTEYADGSIVLSNVRNKETDETYSLKKVTEFVSGVVMDDSRCDGKIFRKLGEEYFADVDFLAGKPIPLAKFGKIYTDNVTSNDAVFQRALSFFRLLSRAISTTTSMPALMLPPGRLRFTQGWVIDFDGFNVVGSGKRNTVLSYNGTGTAIRLGTEDFRASYTYMSHFQIRDFNNTAQIGIDFQKGYQTLLEEIWVMGNGTVGFSKAGVLFSTIAGERSWTNTLNSVHVTNISGVGFLFYGLAPNAIFLNNCKGDHCNYAAWIANGNGIKFNNFQTEDSQSGFEIRIGPYEGTSRVMGCTFSNLYSEVNGSTPSARIFKISRADFNGVNQTTQIYGLDIKNPYMWGGTFAEYALDIDIGTNAPDGILYGTMDGGSIMGFQNAVIKSESGRERIVFSYGIIRNEFGAGSQIPAIESLSGLSGCQSITYNEKGASFSKPIELPKLTTALVAAASPNPGAMWYSAGFDVLQYKNNAGTTLNLISTTSLATTSNAGITKLASQAETHARASNQVVVTPLSLAGLNSSESQSGFITLASQTEVNNGVNTVKAITPVTLETKLKKGAVSTITIADATDEATAIALANANKAKINEIITKLSTIIFK